MEDRELETILDITVMTFNLKNYAKQLGFTNNNNALFVKDDVYETYIKFEDDHLIIWNSGNQRKVIKRYIDIYEGIDNGLYDNESFLKNVLDLLSF